MSIDCAPDDVLLAIPHHVITGLMLTVVDPVRLEFEAVTHVIAGKPFIAENVTVGICESVALLQPVVVPV